MKSHASRATRLDLVAGEEAAEKEGGGVCGTFYVDAEKVSGVEQALPDAGSLETLAESFAVLSNPTRLKILFALSMEELCVCDLAKILDRSVGATSHQLAQLRKLRVVAYRTQGKLAYYRLTAAWVRRLLDDGRERLVEGEP